MEADISEHFMYLHSDAQEIGRSDVLTRPVGHLRDGKVVLLGIDTSGARHLLIPVGHLESVITEQYKAISVFVRELGEDAELDAYLDVSCAESRLFQMFNRLVSEIVSRLEETELDPVQSALKTLDEWRAIIETAATPISAQAVAGLFGELNLLEKLASHNPTVALSSWLGPDSLIHDFVNPNDEAIEVKTTTSVEGNTVAINGLDQLDHKSRQDLLLGVYHLRRSPVGDRLDDTIDRIVNLGIPFAALSKKIASAGYVYGSGSADEYAFEVISARFWQIDPAFPGLKRSSVACEALRGVESVTYNLSLDAVPSPLEPKYVANRLREWSQNE